MSKSSTATVPKIPTQLPAKSAWAKGPPASSSRSQSPAPSAPPSHPTHSRRPSALGPNIPIKDGVGISRNVGAATKQGGPSVSFGSIDDVNAPISSSPAPTPAPSMKADSVKSFGTVPATVSQVNGQSSVQTAASIPPAASSASAPSSVPPNKKFDVKKFFQGSPSTSAPSQPSSPNVRPASISQPSASTSQPPPSQYQQFVPQNGMRQPQQNPGQNGSSGSGPKSPPYRHQAANPAGSRMSNGPSGPSQMSGGMGSPRLSPHPPPGQMPPPMQQMWPYGYYPAPPTMDPQYMPQYAAAGGWYIPGQMPPQQPHAPGGHIPPHNGMPMSPRNPSVPMPGPGTPTPSHATPASHVAPPPPMSHTSSGSIGGMASPPPTPSSTSAPAFCVFSTISNVELAVLDDDHALSNEY